MASSKTNSEHIQWLHVVNVGENIFTWTLCLKPQVRIILWHIALTVILFNRDLINIILDKVKTLNLERIHGIK